MLIKIFSLSFDSIHNGFDDSEIRDFIKDKEVISIQEFFFVRRQIPYLALKEPQRLVALKAKAVAVILKT